jgi:Delta3-Delta2-enoyl-CoA isomerase
MPELSRDAEVYLLDLGDDENRFAPAWMAEVHRAVDEVGAAEGPRALVTTATGKHYSNGLVVEELLAGPERSRAYVAQVQALYAALLRLPVPTVAAMGGHSFGAGAMLGLAHDFRIMRVDRGWFCLPEVELGLPFTPGMGALVQSRLAPQPAHEAMTTSRRYSGPEALAAGIVDDVAEADVLVARAVERARALAPRAGHALGAVRAQMYAGVLEILDREAAGRGIEPPAGVAPPA